MEEKIMYFPLQGKWLKHHQLCSEENNITGQFLQASQRTEWWAKNLRFSHRGNHSRSPLFTNVGVDCFGQADENKWWNTAECYEEISLAWQAESVTSKFYPPHTSSRINALWTFFCLLSLSYEIWQWYQLCGSRNGVKRGFSFCKSEPQSFFGVKGKWSLTPLLNHLIMKSVSKPENVWVPSYVSKVWMLKVFILCSGKLKKCWMIAWWQVCLKIQITWDRFWVLSGLYIILSWYKT